MVFLSSESYHDFTRLQESRRKRSSHNCLRGQKTNSICRESATNDPRRKVWSRLFLLGGTIARWPAFTKFSIG